ncbi:o-succinylbenzoate synthase [Thermogemmatispora sp.]|uniref:o-succinylbenzoate synthase n=1 Tax=Thermogemmatispora sp. TaxID=1968838 RepID=UPI001D56D336|nr:o-succinylbenzoate synthase [Thermogemmatispora sp.]MBX5449433.1 o-succinylbenzoate synthase [Thermogemmatispora sp.]
MSADLRLESIGWQVYRLPLRHPFRTAHALLTERQGAIVRAISVDGDQQGYGELAPLPPFSPSLSHTLAALPKLVRSLAGLPLAGALAVLDKAQHQGETHWPAPAMFALEVALLDLQARLRGQGLLAPYARQAVPVNAVIGASPPDEAARAARQAVAAGFRCLKLKLSGDEQEDSERLAAVRSSVGNTIALRLDANASWSLSQAEQLLRAWASYAIEYIEQPLAAADLEGLRQLRRRSPIPIAVDESLSSLESARQIMDLEAADVLILKPQFLGGLRPALRLVEEASARGMQCIITSALEAGIGVCAALHLAAAHPALTQAAGLATLSLLTSDLLSEPLRLQAGMLYVPAGPGLGVSLDQASLARHAVL